MLSHIRFICLCLAGLCILAYFATDGKIVDIVSNRPAKNPEETTVYEETLSEKRRKTQLKNSSAGKALTRATSCSLAGATSEQELNKAAEYSGTDADIILSTIVVESEGNCQAIPFGWKTVDGVKIRVILSSAAGPTQILKGTREYLVKKYLLAPERKAALGYFVNPFAAALGDMDPYEYCMSEKGKFNNFGLNCYLAGCYLRELADQYGSWEWSFLAWYMGPGAVNELRKNARDNGVPIKDPEYVMSRFCEYGDGSKLSEARYHYSKIIRNLGPARQYVEAAGQSRDSP